MGEFADVKSIGMGGRGFIGKRQGKTSLPPPPLGWSTYDSKLGAANTVFGIAYGNGVWVAGGGVDNAHPGAISTSSDAQHWTAQATPFSSGINSGIVLGVIFDGAQFVAVGENSGQSATVGTSSDGVNWTVTVLASSQLNLSVPSFLGYGGGLYVAPSLFQSNLGGSGFGNSWAASIALGPWTNNTNADFSNHGFQGVPVFDGVDFIAPAQNNSNNPVAAYSTDGLHWASNPISSFGNGDFPTIAYGGGLYVAVSGLADKAEVSPSRVWAGTASTPGLSSGGITALAYGGGIFVATDSAGNAARTVNGIAWTLESVGLPLSKSLAILVYGNGLFVGGGAGGLIAVRNGS